MILTNVEFQRVLQLQFLRVKEKRRRRSLSVSVECNFRRVFSIVSFISRDHRLY